MSSVMPALFFREQRPRCSGAVSEDAPKTPRKTRVTLLQTPMRSATLRPRLSRVTNRPRSSHRRRIRLTPALVAASSLATVEWRRAHSSQARAYLQ